jgi:hypothetical protein
MTGCGCLVFYFSCDFLLSFLLSTARASAYYLDKVSQFSTTALAVILGEGWFDISIINLLVIEVALTLSNHEP